jgi:hypothetical protein
LFACKLLGFGTLVNRFLKNNELGMVFRRGCRTVALITGVNIFHIRPLAAVVLWIYEKGKRKDENG